MSIEKRDVLLGSQLKQSEMDIIKRAAEIQGIRVSEYVRDVMIKHASRITKRVET